MKIISQKESDKQASEQKYMRTTCNGCIFSSSRNNSDGNLENYCSAGRLKKFKESGAQIINVAVPNEECKNYKIVKNRVCNMLRTEDWAEIQKSQGQSEQNFAEIARKEVYVRCMFVVYCGPDEEIAKETDEKKKRQKTKEKIHRAAITMHSIESGDIPPAHICVINNSQITPYDFINYLRREVEELEIKSEWNMEYVSCDNDDSELPPVETSYEKSLRLAFKSNKYNFCSIFLEGDSVPNNYLSDIDIAINDNLERFLVLRPEHGVSGFFIQSLAQKQFDARDGHSNLLERMIEEAKEQKCQHLIQPLNKIVRLQQLQ